MLYMFPFENIRPIQKDFMNDIRNAVENRKHMIAHAPTGLGKTAATLSPVLEYALDNGKIVFFLTPRHSQHYIAIETLTKIKEKHNIGFTVTDLIGKKWLCSVYGIDELANNEFNEYCKSIVHDERCTYYNATRTKQHLLTKPASMMLQNFMKNPIHADQCKDLAKEKFCAYEIVIEMAKSSNIIIADYFHIFSPLRNALLFRIGKDIKDSIIIVDEAHNLPDRIRDVMSSKISTFSLRKAVKEAKIYGYHDIAESIEDINNILIYLRNNKLKQKKENFIEKELFIDAIENRINKMDIILDEFAAAGDDIRKEKKKSYIGGIAKFLISWNSEGTGHARIITKAMTRGGKEYLILKNNCMDPMLYTKEIIDVCHSCILMSGTLQPQSMYQDLLGFDPQRTILKSYVSPFPKENRLNIIITGATTRYSKRNKETYEKIAQYVIECCAAIPGNVAVFFPSYYIRNTVVELIKNNMQKEIILEPQNSNKKERRIIYERFIAQAEKGAVLMGVQAGSFSEGVDMPGKFLNGVVVVGIPLEKPDLSTKALIDYYEYKFKRGWDYGYTYPAMIRSIQAAGRCIRSKDDMGACIFIDERFSWINYKKTFPSDMKIINTNTPSSLISNFFQNMNLNKEI